MVTSAFIFLWNERVGAISWDEATGLGTFEYDSSFIRHGWDLAPIKMPMDLRRRIYSFPELRNIRTFRGLPGLLADVLPDRYGNALINAWLAREGRAADSMNPVEVLCFIGSRGMGALEFRPATLAGSSASTRVQIGSLIDVAEQIMSGRKDFSADLAKNEEKALLDILKIGSSAGGARAKAVIAYNPKTNEVRSGQAEAPAGFSQWLIKFDGVTDRQFGASSGYGRVEMAYHLMAVDAGIEMTECRLLEEHGRAHFMTKRFDRDGREEKLHVQSFCALQHYDFNETELYSYEQLFETMRILGLPYPDAEQLFRRMVFNVMARNCDDHTKNFAFLMDRSGTWRLSPAFDVCHAYRPGSEWVSRHNLSVNGKRKDISAHDLLQVAQKMNIKKAAAIIQQLRSVIENWKTYAGQVSVDPKLRDAIQQTLPEI